MDTEKVVLMISVFMTSAGFMGIAVFTALEFFDRRREKELELRERELVLRLRKKYEH